MKVGIVGYKSSGKSTIFGALTGNPDPPLRPNEVRLGTIRVPDPRIDRLSEIFQPKKTVYAEVAFADLPGVPREGGGGLPNSFIEQVKNLDALALVVRGFESPYVVDAPDPLREFNDFVVELALADQIQVERRLERLAKEGKRGDREYALFERMLAHLEEGRPLRTAGLDEGEWRVLTGYQFASSRPILVVLNLDESAEAEAALRPMRGAIEEQAAHGLALSGQIELEVASLEPDERAPFLADLGLDEPASARFIRGAYALLDLVSFFTVGPDEVRAWTISRGTRAPGAAGKIHSDLERGFIRAEVTKYDDQVSVNGNQGELRKAGKLAIEGKDYVVSDGDVLNIRHNT